MAAKKTAKKTAKKAAKKAPAKKRAKKSTKKAVKATPVEPENNKKVSTGKILLFGLIVAAVIIVAAMLLTKDESVVVNGFTFEKVRCTAERFCYETNVVSTLGIHPIAFYYLPEDLMDVQVQPHTVQRVLDMRNNGSITIAFDEEVPGEVGVAATQIARITGDRLYRIRTKGGVYGRDVSCGDSNEQHTVLYITQSTTNGALLDENGCVLLFAENADEVVRVADAFSMHLLSILPVE